jgi:hypothetical protein
MRRAASLAVADRTIPFVFAGYCTWAAWWLLRMWQDTDEAIFLDWLWPHVFGVAGVAALAFGLIPHNRWLRALSGSLIVVSFVARGWALIAAWWGGHVTPDDTPRIFLSAGAWFVLAYSAAILWSGVLVPLSERRRYIRER